MAVISEGVIVSPSVNSTNTTTQFDSVTIEPGIYLVTASKTINSFTSDQWTVICLSDENGYSPKCCSQIWIPAATTGTSIADQRIYIRTITSAGTGYGSFTKMINEEDLTSGTLVNKTNTPTELYIQNSAPATSANKTIIWIDTSS